MANGIGRVGWRTYVSAAPTTASIITTGLVLNLDASNPLSYPGTGTTWTDLSGNGNTGTLVNGTSYSSLNGGTMLFDGINDMVSVAHSPNLNSTTITVSMWIKFGSSLSGDKVLFSKGSEGSRTYWFYESNGVYFAYGGFTGRIPAEILVNQWCNIVGVQTSTSTLIYLNGVLYSSVGGVASSTTTQGIGINSYSSGIYHASAKNIPQVAIYNRALSATEVLQNFDALKSRYGFTSYTTRTAAFATATGITDTTILNALNTFDAGLISNGLDTKMKAVYPFVGGTASTHKFNFMDPRDVDAAFRLTFSGGWIHSSTGALPNGINAYANSYWIPLSQSAIDNVSYNYYSRTNTFGGVNFGSSDEVYSNLTTMYISINGATNYSNINGMGYLAASSPNSRGLFGMNTINNGTFTSWKNGTKLGTKTSTTTGRPSTNLWIGAGNFPGGPEWGNMECAFFNISTGLSDAESTTFYTLVQALQTSLSRQV